MSSPARKARSRSLRPPAAKGSREDLARSSCPSPSRAAGLSHLGHLSALPDHPHAGILERVPNPHPDANYVTRFTAPEFTSLCPVTGQPDFAHLVIDFTPDQWLVESKSLKLYLGSFPQSRRLP